MSLFGGLAKTLGEKIVNYRRLSGITQKELAEFLKVDPTTLARWERGKSQPLKGHSHKLTVFFTSYQ
jgi:transcriptional regulator with XRE-family HTH domain